MSNEELLKPRFNVIGTYPKSKFKKGDVLERIKNATNDWYNADKSLINADILLDEIEQYPHLFKKLEWWEERDPEDIPQYVKFRSGKVVKVSGFGRVGTNGEGPFCFGWQDEKKGFQVKNARLLMPATEDEYLAQNA